MASKKYFHHLSHLIKLVIEMKTSETDYDSENQQTSSNQKLFLIHADKIMNNA